MSTNNSTGPAVTDAARALIGSVTATYRSDPVSVRQIREYVAATGGRPELVGADAHPDEPVCAPPLFFHAACRPAVPEHALHPHAQYPLPALPGLQRTAARLTLFLFGVGYWTSHRIHYDLDAAQAEGFDDVLVTANLLSAYNVELLTRWTGDPYCLLTLEERNVSPAFADDE